MAKDILTVLIDNTITFILLFGAVWAVRMIFKKKLSAVVQYALWGIVILRLLLPIGIATPASPWNFVGVIPAIARSIPEQKPIAPTNPDNGPTAVMPQAGEGYTPVNYTDNTIQTQSNINNSATPEKATANNPAPAPVQIDWMAAVLYALLAGAIAKGGWQYGRYLKLKRRVKLCGEDAPQLIYDVLEHCKKELNVRKDVKLTLLEKFPSPAIMGWHRPILILPASMRTGIDIEQLSHVFYHELIHLKRRDTMMILLLNVLGAIYWWNPLVWICFRQVRRDMETLCDCMVVKTLGEQGRKRYIETLIAMAGGGRAPQALAGVSLNDGKMNMQRRIQGMYRKKKTGKTVIATVIILTLVMIFATFTTACAPAAALNPITSPPQASVQPSAPAATPTPTAAPATDPTKPSVTLETIPQSAKLITTAKTSFDKPPLSMPNRVYNITKAAGMINGIALQPGQEFSLNTVLGDRSDTKNGWKLAPGIESGILTDMAGMGVDQVATTLFQAVLKADIAMETITRQKHTIHATYAEPGQDAMVSPDGPDLKFINNKTTPIYIFTNVDQKERYIEVSIYGEPLPAAETIVIKTVILKTTTPDKEKEYQKNDNLAQGTLIKVRAKMGGLVCETYREYYINGVLDHSVKLYSDTYEAFPELWEYSPDVKPPKQ